MRKRLRGSEDMFCATVEGPYTHCNDTLDMPFKGRRPQEGMKEELNLKGTWTFSARKFGGKCSFMKIPWLSTNLGKYYAHKKRTFISPGFSSQPTVGNNGSQDSDITPVQIPSTWVNCKKRNKAIIPLLRDIRRSIGAGALNSLDKENL